MKLYFILLLPLLISCSQLKYKKTVETKLPELATIGVFEKYPLGNYEQTKTVPLLNQSIRLKYELISIEQSLAYSILKPDSITSRLDSTLVSFSILDQFGLIQELNENKELFEFLKTKENLKIVTTIEMLFPKDILEKIKQCEEIYLTSERNKILSIQLQKNNKLLQQIEFSQGKIVDYSASNLCWGSPKGFKVQIIDLVTNGENCGENGYLSYRRAQKQNEIKF